MKYSIKIAAARRYTSRMKIRLEISAAVSDTKQSPGTDSAYSRMAAAVEALREAVYTLDDNAEFKASIVRASGKKPGTKAD